MERKMIMDARLAEAESRFADIIWNHEPISSRLLAELAEKELSWKKSTTYTVLKRLCLKGLFQNREGTVTSVISKEAYIAMQSEQFVEQTFSGSLPAFLVAFGSRKKLTDREVEELRGIIESMRG